MEDICRLARPGGDRSKPWNNQALSLDCSYTRVFRTVGEESIDDLDLRRRQCAFQLEYVHELRMDLSQFRLDLAQLPRQLL